MSKKLYQELIKEMQEDGHRFWAGDNVSDYVTETDKEILIEGFQ